MPQLLRGTSSFHTTTSGHITTMLWGHTVSVCVAQAPVWHSGQQGQATCSSEGGGQLWALCCAPKQILTVDPTTTYATEEGGAAQWGQQGAPLAAAAGGLPPPTTAGVGWGPNCCEGLFTALGRPMMPASCHSLWPTTPGYHTCAQHGPGIPWDCERLLGSWIVRESRLILSWKHM